MGTDYKACGDSIDNLIVDHMSRIVSTYAKIDDFTNEKATGTNPSDIGKGFKKNPNSSHAKDVVSAKVSGAVGYQWNMKISFEKVKSGRSVCFLGKGVTL